MGAPLLKGFSSPLSGRLKTVAHKESKVFLGEPTLAISGRPSQANFTTFCTGSRFEGTTHVRRQAKRFLNAFG
jgi:hypothetical protein